MPKGRFSLLTISPPRVASLRRSLFGGAWLGVLLSALVVPPGSVVYGRDILRSGNFSSASSNSGSSGTSGAPTQTATQLRTNVQDKLARTTQALTAMKAMQDAARTIAAGSTHNLGLDPNHPGQVLPNVPNGLLTGGLQPLSGGRWTGAKPPKQTTVNGQTTVTIKQTNAQALLDWQTFNIGKNTTLNFNQSAGGDNVGKWIAFNLVNDPSGSPSQILGSIQAPGQVYVVNANGIIFGGASQVNTHALVASSLQINENLISRGLLNNPDDQFLFSALAQPAGSNGTPAFTPAVPLTPNGQNGDVIVQKGAVLSAPTTADHIGGRVALIGPNVKNAGTISTPDGQTILAAGLQVGLTAHDSSDASLRGLDVYVGAIVDPASLNPAYAGKAVNSGLINALRANVTMAGKNVLQNGFINSSTSVSYNGRVDLLANYNAVSSGGLDGVAPFLPSASGTVTLGLNSVTQILPEWDSLDRVVGTALTLSSQINLQGKAIHLASASEVFAPNADVTLQAGNWNYVSTATSGNSLPTDKFVFSKGQIYLDAGADIDVAGSMDVLAPVSENIITVQLLGAQLADSPLQRLGLLRGQSIAVDIRQSGIYNGYAWVGTPLADASGYVGLIQRTVGELTIGGGTVNLLAGDSVVMQPGSNINVSGGYINYQGGAVSTTRLIGADGNLYDIANATPDRIYNGIYTGTYTVDHPKWGVTESYTSSLFQSSHYEASYNYGGSGGTINITAPSVALDGNLLGQTVAGDHQRAILPTPSTLALTFQGQEFTSAYSVLPTSPTPPDLVFQSNSTLAPVDPFTLDSAGDPLVLSADRKAEVILSPDLVSKDGFGNLTINNSDGNITVPANVTLEGQPGGSFTLLAANLDLEGKMIVPGGKLAFSVYDFSPVQAANILTTPAPDPTRGNFTLGSTALLSTAGLIVDDRNWASAPGSLPLVTNGGSISIASYNADLLPGSVIDVSGGAAVSATGKQTYGQAGSISIAAGQDPGILSILGGKLTLGSTLEGYAGGKGGALSILAPLIQIGGTASHAGGLLLSPDFFSQGGFASFTLKGLGIASGANTYLPGLVIAPGTVIAPVEASQLLMPSAADGSQLVFQPQALPTALRTPVSLAFNAVHVTDSYNGGVMVLRGDLVLGAGAMIQADPGASVSLSGDTVLVNGSITAPGGSISITGGSDSSTLFLNNDLSLKDALATVILGANSSLSTAGTTVLTPDVLGYRTGYVLNGGNISVTGNLVAQTGSVLDVSGTSDTLNYRASYLSAVADPLNVPFTGYSVVPIEVDSNGGSISLVGKQALFTDATFLGAAGGASALGGSLSISSGIFTANGVAQTPTSITVVVRQNGQAYLASNTGIGQAVLDAKGTVFAGGGHFGVNRFADSELSSLTLGGVVDFSGPVSIAAASSLNVGSGGFIYGNSAITLSAPYVKLGTAFQMPLTAAEIAAQEANGVFTVNNVSYGASAAFAATYGQGSLTVNAGLIDVGNLSLQGIGNLNLLAANGDLRGDGTLDVAGHIYVQAGQIYPPSAVSFTIAAEDYSVDTTAHRGSVTITGSGNRQLPLSAGGELNVYGSIINQGGVLRAPLGVINIGTNGTDSSLTNGLTGQAFSTTQKLTLSSGSVTSVSAYDPLTGQALVIPYGVNLNGISWIDPTGTDITAGGVVAKSVNLSGATIAYQKGAEIDLRGGGDLYAYRFVSGTGGTHDILNSTTSFAVIPGYQTDYAPFAPYNSSATEATNFGTDIGYVNSTLKIGDMVYLDAGSGLAAGFYTLLPARYALLPGAYLVTPQSGVPVGSLALADGTSLVSGYRANNLDAARSGALLNQRFQIASGTVVRDFAEYDGFSANTFLTEGAVKNNTTIPRLPEDSGQLVFQATKAMTIQGTVDSQSLAGGKGSLVDISSPVDIVIAGKGFTGGTGQLILNAGDLSAIGAESLLIGGVRSFGTNGTTVTVTTGSITVNNAGTPLTGSDIILVANNALTLAPGAQILQTGTILGGADTLLLGDASVPGSGDGVLLRVSSDPTAQILRSGVDSATTASMTIGAGVQLTGASLTLDSTYATSLDPSAKLNAQAINLGSGQISIALNNPGTIGATAGLVIQGSVLQNLEAAQTLSLLSYSSLDIYGTGNFGASTLQNLSLHAGEIRGFNQNGGTASFTAANLQLDNRAGVTGPGAVAAPDGTLSFIGDVIKLGKNAVAVDQFAQVALNALREILTTGKGALATQGALTLNSPLLTGAQASDHTITATGALNVIAPSGSAASTLQGGLGAKLTLVGQSVTANGAIVLPSGSLTLHATGGDVLVGNEASSVLDVGGTAKQFFNLTQYTSGGIISLISDTGSVTVASGSNVNVSAPAAGGDAGTLSVSAPQGLFTMNGKMLGQKGAGGTAGSFSLDVGTLAGGALSSLAGDLNTGGFMQNLTFRIRNGDVLVDGTTVARAFDLSTDTGSITVSGTVDASGSTGGSISLEAAGSLTLESGALLTVAAQDFSSAGKGGAVTLEAGAETNGTFNSAALLDLQSGSTIDLSVASNTAGSAALGDFTGTLHLRAPQLADNSDLQINPIDGTITGASSIVIEGYRIYDLTGSGAITSTVESSVNANGLAFTGNTAAITARLLANNGSLASVLHVQPGAEIINTTGNLTLASTWDLSSFRYGPNVNPAVRGSGEAGVLTLRAAGNLVFNFQASLSDGFDPTTGSFGMWDANLLAAGMTSWSYRLVSGADFAAADFRQVTTGHGSVLLGQGAPALPVNTNNSRSSATLIPKFYQTIRTGTGDIDIYSGSDVQLLNSLATIYTAGTQAGALANFDPPVLNYAQNGSLGSTQTPIYGAQYSLGGGNVTISAQNDIAHYLLKGGTLVADSTKEMPTNWLYRRGWINPTTGQFGATYAGGEIQSTSWWVDFSNFFQGVGALGGGNVTLTAGNNVSNVDAVIPTNARMPKGTPNASNLNELGGGDLVVRAGNDLDGGTYYIERGQGTLTAGGSIHTNSTRAALSQKQINSLGGAAPDPVSWLPTTLFLGKGSFDVSATGDVLLGPVANPFLLPQGINNGLLDKSYFSTYATSDTVNVSSLSGSITLKDRSNTGDGSLQNWYQNVLMYYASSGTYAFISQPWLRLFETKIAPFQTNFALMPGTLRALAYSGDINVIGNLTLSPSPTGTVDLIAAGSINGLQNNGLFDASLLHDTSANPYEWATSAINLSDADPASIPGVATPLSLPAQATGFRGASWLATPDTLFTNFDNLFAESGSTQGLYSVIQTQQALHAAGVLHAADPNPVHLYALAGDISGLTFYAGKSGDVIAGNDITDIALYLQNNQPNDLTLVEAGRDLVAYDLNSPLRLAAQTAGNLLLNPDGVPGPSSGDPNAGDIQIGGPGTLEVFSGRDFNLGVGNSVGDGTGVGITSIGNARNPYLPFAGADIITGAGLGAAAGLESSRLDFTKFIAEFLSPDTGGLQSVRYLADLAPLLDLTANDAQGAWSKFRKLSKEQQNELALQIFYDVLRDAGRDFNNSASPNFGTYTEGQAAIATLFPGNAWQGDISLTSREIKTANGGNISIFAPGGSLTVGYDLGDNQPTDQGILTEHGGNISIFTDGDVNVGTSRIFTLRGGDEIIWSSHGNIAAGAASKTVQSAPPTRVLIDPQSGDVQTDLAGLATGGGIGVLESVSGVPPGNVDLIAPTGIIDAGDAGIRVSGNLNLAAVQVLNASNIQVTGTSAGTPTVVAAPNLSAALTSASNTAGAASSAADQAAKQAASNAQQPQDIPSIITVEVLGFGEGS